MLFLLENDQIEWVLKKLFLLAYQKFQQFFSEFTGQKYSSASVIK